MTRIDTDNRELQLKIDEYSDMLFKLSYVRLQNVQDAEDVVQEVFYQYLKHAESFESSEHEKAWLLRVALNTCGKLWRSAWRRHRSDEEWTEETGHNSVDQDFQRDVSGPEESILKREEYRKLLDAVSALPARYREVIHLFYYEGFSVKEIARIVGRGESTITSQLTRGRELLRKSLKEEFDFE